ncbi:MAG: oligoribonuclease [Burkholderiales bacterium]|nr:oligoribonuclease [Burkholderiales bacterium]OJX09450.1 MAG: oligoribonuclease [Burkholderiales bacterium 70-64]
MSQAPIPPESSEAAHGSPVRRSPDESLLVWVDMEMTGLNPIVDRIIEVAMVVTDEALNVIAHSEAFAIRQPASVLEAMDQWNRATHGRSGLVERVLASSWTEATAEQALLEFLAPLVPPGKSPMCGNSICQDRRFMARYMPRLEAYFHYRNLDVSTLKELCRRWRPEVARAFVKRSAHTAMADITESIDELRHYRDHFLLLERGPA